MTDPRPDPIRCEVCNGFVYGPVPGELAEIVRRVRHTDQADPTHPVCACGRCGNLYEIRQTREAA